MNVLILVMSARFYPYGMLMDAQRETWDSEDHPQTKTLYYCGRNGPDTDKVFYSKFHGESLEEVAPRTIEAFEKSLELDWDYMARPHSSTYVHKKNLVKFCETLPDKDVVCGTLTEGEKPFIWGGCHYVFSRDVIERMVEHKDKWNNSVMEDHSITELVNFLGVPVTEGHSASINQNDGTYTVFVYGHGENFSVTDFNQLTNQIAGHFFVRVKQDMRREEDVRIMKELFKYFK